MNFDIDYRTIFLARHGSFAYGLNIETSDEDYKGICIKPKSYYFGFLNSFEQYEHVGKKDGIDQTIYSIDKFVKLATDCNPNIIEVLNVEDQDIIRMDQYGEKLCAMKDMFISKKARFTFSGYAYSQLKRIKTHRAWLLNPPKEKPTRQAFGLSDGNKVSQSELGAFEAAVRDGMEIDMPKDILTMFIKEKQYLVAKQHWDQYNLWKQNRNPVRAEMEAKMGFDGKHAMHLIRLMRMCREILQTGIVNVKRQDREELLSIRNGLKSYDEIIEESEKLDKECEELYKTSTLRKEPDRNKINDMLISITEEYLSKN